MHGRAALPSVRRLIGLSVRIAPAHVMAWRWLLTPVAARPSAVPQRPVHLSALSLSSFAGGVTGVASSLPLGFLDSFPCNPLSEFRIAGLLLGFQRGLPRGSLGGLRSGKGGILTCFKCQLGCYSLGDADFASHPGRLPRDPPLDGGGALGRRPCPGCSLQ